VDGFGFRFGELRIDCGGGSARRRALPACPHGSDSADDVLRPSELGKCQLLALVDDVGPVQNQSDVWMK
jgi:hypothetical protein